MSATRDGLFNYRILHRVLAEILSEIGVKRPVLVEVGGEQDSPASFHSREALAREVARACGCEAQQVRHFDPAGDEVPYRCDFAFLHYDGSPAPKTSLISLWNNQAKVLAGRCVDGQLPIGAGHCIMMPAIDCWTDSEALANAVNRQTNRQNTFLAIPTGGQNSVDGATMISAVRAHASRRTVYMGARASSLLTMGFNSLLCEALNARGEPNSISRFILLHSDIVPLDHDWVDALLDLMEHYEADVVSVVSPIKDMSGLTSTAIDTDDWRPRRLTMKEIAKLPETFYTRQPLELVDAGLIPNRSTGRDPNILFNTGLMAIRLERDWVKRIAFEVNDRIVQGLDGKFRAECQPEDWNFSRRCHELGVKCVVTREIKLHHVGAAMYNNYSAWGTMETDEMNTPEVIKAERNL